MPWQQIPEERDRPLLQCFREDCVVGVVDACARDLPCLPPLDAPLVHEDAHHLRDDKRGVRVVELDGDLFGQSLDRAALGKVPAQDVVETARDKEILLAEAELLSLLDIVVWIEDLRQVLGADLAVHGLLVGALVEILEVELVVCLRRPEAQVVDIPAAVADDGDVVGHSRDTLGGEPPPDKLAVDVHLAGLPSEADCVGISGPLELPGIPLLLPGVWLLNLCAVDNLLAEEPVVVSESVSDARQMQCGERIDEACGKPSEAAVAKPRVPLHLLHVLPRELSVGKRLAALVIEPHVHGVVAQQPSDQELQREIICAADLLPCIAVLRLHPPFGELVPQADREGEIPVSVSLLALADGECMVQMPLQGIAKVFGGHVLDVAVGVHRILHLR